MNRLFYRIIFNTARGMLMVVADIAHPRRGLSPACSGTPLSPQHLSRLSALTFSLWLALGAVTPLQAAVIADGNAPAGQQPTIITSANGLPQVNIQTPSAGGVSHNTYQQFDVDKQGVILNNSHTQVNTQLAGMVTGNPWLAKGEATIILNEVNSRDPSKLHGYVEVAGRQAQVVIANPSGITCNGCGFINANRATLTTATPQLHNGNLMGYRVNDGKIVVEGNGMDSSRTSHTDIIARAVQINAAIHAQDLQITAGRNQVDAAHQQVSALADEGSPTPQLAIDVAQMGGMYAGKIRLLSTEKGVGVNHAGQSGSEAGLVTITADGRIDNSGHLSSRDGLQLSATGDIHNSGKLQAQQALALHSDGAVTNSGSLWSAADTTVQAAGAVANSGALLAGQHLTVSGQQIISDAGSTLAAAVQADGRVGTVGNLTLSARDNLALHGQVLAGGDIHARGEGLDAAGSQIQANNITLDSGQQSLSTTGAKVNATQHLAVTTAGTLNNHGGLLAGDKLTLSAPRLDNSAGQIVHSGSEPLLLQHQQGIDNRGGTIATRARDMTLTTDWLDNQGGTLTHAGEGTLTLNAATLSGTQGHITSGGALALAAEEVTLDNGSLSASQLDITAGQLSNQHGRITQSGSGTLTLNVRRHTDNSGGTLAANGSVALTTATLDNQQGQIQAAGHGSLTVTARQTDNRHGLLAGAEQLTLHSEALNNDNGQIVADRGDLTLTSTQPLTSQAGLIAAGGDLTLAAQGLDNQQGKLLARQIRLALAQGALSNQRGIIAAQHALTVDSGALNNDRGLLQSGGAMRLDTHGQRLSNRDSGGDGGIDARGSLQLTSGALDNSTGRLTADGDATLTSGALDNHSGDITATGTLTLSTAGELNNDAGRIQAGGDMQLDSHGHAISNRNSTERSGLLAGGALTLASGALDNSQGILLATHDLAIDAAALNNQAGKITARGAAHLTSDALNNSGGRIQSAGDLTLNTRGHILDNHDTRTSGGLISLGKMTLTSGVLDNHNGQTLAAGDSQIQGQAVDNRGGTLASEGQLTLNLSDNLDNQQGSISSGRTLALTANALDNRQGVMAGDGAAVLAVTTTDNRQGQLAARGPLSLHGQQFDNSNGGLLQSGGDMQLVLDTLGNQASGNHGGITSQGNMSLGVTHLNNDHGLLLSQHQATLATDDFSNVSGTLVAQQALQLTSHSDTDNHGGLIQGTGVVVDTDGHQLNNQGGTLNSLAALQLTGGELNNQQGTLGAKGDATLTVSALDNRDGGRLVSEQVTTLTTGQLHNQHGQIQSVGDLRLNALQGVIDNTLGLLRSGAQVILSAASLHNADTRQADKGIEGQSLMIDSDDVDNHNGSLLAAENLTLTSAGTLDNRQGTLTAGNALTLQGATLDLRNTGGTVSAGKWLTLNADRVGGDGRLLSAGSLTLNSRQGLDNQGDIIAGDDLNLTTGAQLTNNGNVLAGGALTVSADSLSNQIRGEISGDNTRLTVSHVLNNRGLIDGHTTRLQATTLTNQGRGRIYGDALALSADTLNNLAEDNATATLAARERLDIATATLNNRDHALIYSGGSLALGGTLDSNNHVSGQAVQLNNHSATIESAGDMALSVATLNNINDHFTTERVTVSQESRHEYQHKGSPTRWDAATDGVFVDHNSSDELLNLNTPDKHGFGHDNYYEYEYTHTIEEERIKESDPGKILAGGRLGVQATQLRNDKSQIVAGSTLDIAAATVDNVMPEGQRWITDSGTVTHFWRKQKKHKDQQKRKRNAYRPPVVIESITLHPGRLEGNSAATGSGLQLTAVSQTTAPTVTGLTGAVNAGLTVADPATLARPLAGITRPDLSTTDIPSQQPVVLQPGQQFDVPLSSGSVSSDTPTVIKVSGVNTHLPDNSLFVTHPDVQAPYLVETDPRFTDRKKWLGTDYMQNAFAQDPTNIHKRLGDGYYEQRLVREQVIALTGGRYLGDYRSDEAQFKGLMDAGIAFGQQYDLIPGVALSPAQMRLLTHDILWLVDTPVQLPDGSWQTVQVPQVYARVNPDAPDGSGALLAGREVNMNLTGDLINHGTISGQRVKLTADNLVNQAGTLHGADVTLQARTDITSTGGLLSATHSLLAAAGRDITLTSPTVSASRQEGDNSYDRTTIRRTSGLQVTGDGGQLQLAAGRDITLTAAQVNNQAANSQTWLTAGNDLILNTVTTAARDHLVWDKDNWLSNATTQQNGSTLSGGGKLTLQAGHDLSATAATVSAGQNLSIAAGNDIHLSAGINTTDYEEHQRHSGSNGAFSSTTTTTADQLHQQQAQGTLLSGDTVTLQAGRDLTLTGSDTVGEHQVSLTAGRDLLLTTTAEHSSESHLTQEKHAGLSGSGGVGFTYGSQSQKVTDTAQTISQHGSTVGATQGDVILHAGDVLTVNGSELIAGHDMILSGQNVSLTAATEQSQQTHTVEQHSSGLTLALSGTAGSALNQTVQSVNQSRRQDNERLQALQAVKAGLSAVQASQAARLDAAQGGDPTNNNTAGISLSYGSQSSKSTQEQTQYSAVTSSLTAGHDLTVVASGQGNKGNILAEGSQLQATHDLTLDAQHDITLLSAQNASSLTGSNHSSGSNLGIGLGVGSGGWGIQLSAGVNSGKGSENGNGTTHDETVIGAGNQLTLHSGHDTTLQGAQVSSDRLLADIGHNLTIASEQDSDHYHSQQQNNSISGSFAPGSLSGSISASQDKMNSDYLSVNEQSGLFAGNSGYDITVGNYTQLNGAVIASTATSDRNRLDTGTLGWSSLHNSAEYNVEHSSAGLSSGGSMGSQFAGNMANSLLNGLSDHDKADSTTQAAVSNGTLVIRDKAHQQQNTADLSRDTDKANDSIHPIFNKEKAQDKIEQAQLTGDIGTQLADIGRTEGNIRGTLAGKAELAKKGIREPEKGASAETWAQYNALLTATESYKTEQQKWGTGGSYQQAITAATAALQGLNGGSVTAAIAGASAPYIAEIIGHHAGINNNDTAKVAAHAVANAVLASLQGQDALAGAAGAATGELTGILAMQMYGKPVSELSETDKQTISALATVAAGIAGGIAGDSTAAAVAGAQAGKTTVENNALGLPSGMMSYGQAVASWNQYALDNNLSPEQTQAGIDKLAKGELPEGANITQVIVNGYKDGALIAGAWYLGPAASVGEVISGTAISAGANGAYQWYDLSRPGNEDKNWDYWSSATAAVTGGLAPGRGIWQNVGIAAGGTIFTDGPDVVAVGSSALGAAGGGAFGKYAPGFLNQFTNKEIPGFVYDVSGSSIYEIINGAAKDALNPAKENKNDK